MTPQTRSSHGGGSNSAPRWLLLLGLSVALSALLLWLAIPAALLLGPMLAGILLTATGGSVEVPDRPFVLAQGLIGCMVANMLPLSIAGEILHRWPVFAFGVLSVIGASALLGWVLTRMRVLPGSTALWGLSPGGATAMVVMAEAHGADAQLVALMQYLRVVLVAAVASIVARMWGFSAALHAAHPIVWFPPLAWVPLAETVALAVLGAVLGNRLRLQAGALLVPLVLGVILTRFGLMTIELPRWLLTGAYALIGWRIGLRFTRPLLIHAARALPRVLACTLALIVFCGVLAVLLVAAVGIDPLTAYLATSPGGADSVAIIAATSKVDASFVMAMQMGRLIAVLLLGPPLARFIATHADPGADLSDPTAHV
jgi:uncharacterized protein